MQGNHLSGFHPFVRDLIAQRALQREEPFQLYTCWNGMVAMPAHPFIAVRAICVGMER